MPSEYGREFKSLTFTKNIIVTSAEFDGEWVGNQLQSGFIVNSPEFEQEFGSVSITPTVGVQSAEFGHETGSTSIFQGAEIFSAEFDREFLSPDITSVHSRSPASSEYDREITSAPVAMVAIQPNSFERTYEIMGNIGSVLDVRSGEFDYELRPIFVSQVTTIGAEFDYEALGGEELAQTHVVSPGSAEFGREFLSLGLFDTNFDIGWEVGDVSLEQFSAATTITSYESEDEWGSPTITQEHNFPGENSEILNLEFDYEAQSGSFPGEPEIGNAEFGWEVQSPRFRYFPRRPKTPRHRRVAVRVRVD